MPAACFEIDASCVYTTPSSTPITSTTTSHPPAHTHTNMLNGMLKTKVEQTR